MVAVSLEGLMTAILIWIGFGALLYALIESEVWLPAVRISWLIIGAVIVGGYWLMQPSVPIATTTQPTAPSATFEKPVSRPSVATVNPNLAPPTERHQQGEFYATLVQYDGPRIKSGNNLDAQFVDDGGGNGEAVMSDATSQRLRGKFLTIKPGATDWPKPKILDRATLNRLQLMSDRPWFISTVSNSETVLECVFGDSYPHGQKNGACRDNHGNRYHVKWTS